MKSHGELRGFEAVKAATKAQRLEANSRLRRAGAKWLEEVRAWEHFCTVTFSYDVTAGSAHDSFRRWLRAIAIETRQHLAAVSVLETQRSGRLHVHALTAPAEQGAPISPNRMKAMWHRGTCKISPYAGGGSIEGYLLKTADGEFPAHFDIGCPRERVCRRAKGCRWTDNGWSG